MKKIYLDEKGYQEYLNAIDNLKEKIQKNSRDMSEYQSDDAYGDGWHHNFAYEQAMQKDNSLNYELKNKMKDLKNIVVVKSSGNPNIADIGATIELEFDGEVEYYLLSGGYNSDFEKEIPVITLNSPLGVAIYKKKIGDSFEYKIGENTIGGRIINIKYQ